MKEFNWETGVYQAPELQDEQGDFRITIAADWGALWDYADIMQRDPMAVYGDLLPLFRNSDFNIVGIECTLGEKGTPINKGGPHLRGAAGTEQVLSKIPFHLGCLANNHIMDFGPDSLQETIEILHDADVKTIGAGSNGEAAAKPAIVKMKGATLGIINCAEGESGASIDGGPGAHPFDVRALEAQIHDLKQQVDAVLVIFHGGREFAPSPPPYVVEGLRRLADAGACAVIAQHPHVPQGAEIYHDVPIAYSQGNFVFRWGDTNNDPREYLTLGYLLHLDFAGKDLVEFSITPYQMKREGVFTLADEEKTQFLQKLKQVSDLLNDPQKIKQAWEAFVDSEGEEWMLSVLQAQLDTFEENPTLSAARLRNVFFCPAHRELYIDGLGRIARGEVGNSPEWAKGLVEEWQKNSEEKSND